MYMVIKKMTGLYLLEILIVVMLIGILAIATRPYYYHYLVKARRLEAQSYLLRAATEMERLHLNTLSYRTITFSLLTVPQYTKNNHYHLNIESSSDTDYLLSATPLGDQAMRDLTCGTLLLDATHKKYVTGHGRVEECWEQ
jgi:type IV pilus assembly protein PilE